jgi:hypothetical protein
MFDEPTMWQDLIGPDAPDGAAENLAETWRVFPWPWQQPWLKEVVTRIEIDEDDSTLTVTLSPEAAQPLLAQIQDQDEPAG